MVLLIPYHKINQKQHRFLYDFALDLPTFVFLLVELDVLFAEESASRFFDQVFDELLQQLMESDISQQFLPLVDADHINRERVVDPPDHPVRVVCVCLRLHRVFALMLSCRTVLGLVDHV